MFNFFRKFFSEEARLERALNTVAKLTNVNQRVLTEVVKKPALLIAFNEKLSLGGSYRMSKVLHSDTVFTTSQAEEIDHALQFWEVARANLTGVELEAMVDEQINARGIVDALCEQLVHNPNFKLTETQLSASLTDIGVRFDPHYIFAAVLDASGCDIRAPYPMSAVDKIDLSAESNKAITHEKLHEIVKARMAGTLVRDILVTLKMGNSTYTRCMVILNDAFKDTGFKID